MTQTDADTVAVSPLTLGSLLRPYRRHVAALTLTSFAGGLLEALFLVFVTRTAFAITDGDERVGLVASRFASFPQAIALAFLLVVLRAGLAVAAAWQSSHLNATATADLRLRLGHAFLRSSWSAQHGQQVGRLQELLTTFAQQGSQLIGSAIGAYTSGANLIALVIFAVVIDPIASLVLVVAVALLASVLRPLRAAVRRQASISAASSMELATSLGEVSQLGMEMHVFNVQPPTERRVDRLIREAMEATRRLGFLHGIVPVIYTGLAYLALVGGLAVVSTIDAANITSVGAVMLVMLRSLSYGQGIQTSTAGMNASLPFLDSLNAALHRYEIARLIDGNVPVGDVGRLTFDQVSFEYVPGVPVLRSLSFSIEEHEVVGVVGPSGSGKSTLVQLLLGLRSPTSGIVQADGRDVNAFSRSEWARRVTFVPQQAHLIEGTVADNVRFLRAGVSDEQVEIACRHAHLHDDIAGFADGYRHEVGPQGGRLSGGQQQRLIIARALVELPDVLILDEPTSALDVRSEHLIRETLDDLRHRMTIVIIAHRLSTLAVCDRIMVIQDGELKAFDTSVGLETTSDFYSEAVRLSGLR